jgi:hypothetical protein
MLGDELAVEFCSLRSQVIAASVYPRSSFYSRLFSLQEFVQGLSLAGKATIASGLTAKRQTH